MNLAKIFAGTNTPIGNELRQQDIAREKAEAEKQGLQITGYKPYTERTRRKGGGYNSTQKFRPIYQQPAPAAAPAPAPAPAAPAYRTPPPVNNPYKDEADRLLKTIKEMEAAKPKQIYSASKAVQPTDLTISSASKTSKQTGTSSFKRVKRKTVAGNNLRTIQSVNI